jgi:SAM-dependent methyltransferase
MTKREEIFGRIYESDAWRDPRAGEAESRSGPGSEVARTELLRRRLTKLLLELQVKTVLDVPCGDFNWMRLTELPGIDYLGADIVRPMIARNRERYAQAGREFMALDMVRDPLPRADLILCRDGWVHLSFVDTARALENMLGSGAEYLLATTFTAHARNRDIATGGWRRINLQRTPYCFPPPLQTIGDERPDGTAPDKALALYRMAELGEPLRLLQRTAARGRLPAAFRSAVAEVRRAAGRAWKASKT